MFTTAGYIVYIVIRSLTIPKPKMWSLNLNSLNVPIVQENSIYIGPNSSGSGSCTIELWLKVNCRNFTGYFYNSFYLIVDWKWILGQGPFNFGSRNIIWTLVRNSLNCTWPGPAFSLDFNKTNTYTKSELVFFKSKMPSF